MKNAATILLILAGMCGIVLKSWRIGYRAGWREANETAAGHRGVGKIVYVTNDGGWYEWQTNAGKPKEP